MFKPIASDAMLVPTVDKQGFDIWLSWTSRSSVEEWLVSLGHELGHTFAYGIKLTPPLQPWWQSLNFIDKDEEEFCEQFGAAWACLDEGQRVLRSNLSELLTRGRVEVLNQENCYTLFDFSEAR